MYLFINFQDPTAPKFVFIDDPALVPRNNSVEVNYVYYYF